METKAGYPKSLFFFVEQFICQWIWELAAQAVFLFVDRVTKQSVSIEKDDIFKVKKVQKPTRSGAEISDLQKEIQVASLNLRWKLMHM